MIMSKVFVISAILLSTFLMNAPCVGQTQNTPPSDLKWYLNALQRELGTTKEQLNKLKEEKGFDAEGSRLINESFSEIRAIEAKVHDLQSKKMASSLVVMNMSIIKERRGVIRDNLVALNILIPNAPQNYPERCAIYKSEIPERGEELAKKEGLIMKIGKIDQTSDSDSLVFSTTDPSDPTKHEDYQVDPKVGLIGSEDPNAITTAKQPTPADMNVKAWVDTETKRVMCISQPLAVK